MLLRNGVAGLYGVVGWLSNGPRGRLRHPFDEALNLYKHASLFFGRVAYTHALGIDRPLSVVRFDYADTAFNRPFVRWAPFSLVPHWNLRGRRTTARSPTGRSRSA